MDESVTRRFPGSTATTGSAASGAGDNREIPMEEGGDIGYTGRFVVFSPDVGCNDGGEQQANHPSTIL